MPPHHGSQDVRVARQLCGKGPLTESVSFWGSCTFGVYSSEALIVCDSPQSLTMNDMSHNKLRIAAKTGTPHEDTGEE